MPIIYGRAVLRSISKYSGARWVQNIPEEEDSFFTHFLEFAGDLYKEGSEKADLRSWTSLPGNVFAHAFQLDPGSYEMEFRYINKQGLPIYSEFRDVQIKQGHLVHLLETHLAF